MERTEHVPCGPVSLNMVPVIILFYNYLFEYPSRIRSIEVTGNYRCSEMFISNVFCVKGILCCFEHIFYDFS